jgi:hypothetical protein
VGFVQGWCGRCGAEWAGEDRCHCAACDQTFDDEHLFDTHRAADGRWTTGQVMGLVQTRNGIWLRPLDLSPAY